VQFIFFSYCHEFVLDNLGKCFKLKGYRINYYFECTSDARRNPPHDYKPLFAAAVSLNQKIAEDLKAAMKAKDKDRVSCLRMLKTSLKNLQVEKGRELEDKEIHAAISSSVRKSKESAAEFRKGGREDLVLKEEREIKILYEYLPQQLTPDEIEKTLREIIEEISASSKDLGKVMKAAMARMAGQAQGKEVNEIAIKLLP
jgi:uncharacterized protein YqeY